MTTVPRTAQEIASSPARTEWRIRNAPLMSLADIAESIHYGYTASASPKPVGPKFLRITDIVAPQIDWETVPHCKIEEKAMNKYRLHPGDIVVARTGATVGHAKLIRDDHSAIFASYLVRIRIDTSKADPGYVGRVVESSLYKRFVLSNVGGAAQPNANARILSSFRIPIPPQALQTRIASILSAYDDLIENNRRRIRLLEQAARMLYEEWFVRLRFPGHEGMTVTDGVPEGWEKKKPLSALCNEVRESVDPKTLPPDTAYIGLEHMPRRSITLNEWTSSVGIESTKLAFRQGDVLFGKIRPYFHKVGFTLTDGIASSDAIVIRPADPDDYEYLLSLLSSDRFVSLASKTVREGSKMPRADWRFLSASDVLVPEPPVLNAFRRVIRPVLDQLRNLALSNRRLATACDLLLPRLMNGKFAV